MPSIITEQPTFLHDIKWYKLELEQECKKNEQLIKAHALEISVLKKNYEDECKCFLNKIELLEGRVKLLTHQIYGNQNEKGKGKDNALDDKKPPACGGDKNPRGQQKGSVGHGRSSRPENLPIVEVVIDIPEEKRICTTCNLAYQEFGEPEVSEILEIEVCAYKKKIIRKKYKTCKCHGRPEIVTAPPANKLFPKTKYGISIWAKFLIDKYIFSIPTARTCKSLKPYLGHISPGTIIGGCEKMEPLFSPFYIAAHLKLLQDNYFHIDETYWKMLLKKCEGINNKRMIWGVHSPNVRYFHFSKNRSAENLKDIFADLDKSIHEIVIVCDRFSSYKSFAKSFVEGLIITLAFCWAHVRRDFLNGAIAFPDLAVWMNSWVEKISQLYGLNDKRLKHWNASELLSNQSEDFQKYHQELGEKLLCMKKEMDSELASSELHPAKRKVLESLNDHWVGLNQFYTRPFIAMDNNLAERECRICVVGRKNFYGSGAEWSLNLSAMMYTFIKTYELWDLDASKGIHYYLLACSENGGNPPKNLENFLPWKMSEERKAFFRSPMNSKTPEISSA